MTQTILVINSDPSSIKYQLANPKTGETIAKGLVERIGDSLGNIKHAHSDEVTTEELPIPDHEIGMREAPRLSDTESSALDEVGTVVVGHHIVQGGKYLDGPALVTDEVRDLIEQLCPVAPPHSPVHLKGTDVARELMPDVPHVVAFDTVFFQQFPDKTVAYALNAEVAEKHMVRRYGAHGTSHQFVFQGVAKRLDRDDLKQVVTRLGNSVSVSVILNDKLVDTSVGLIPLEGLMVGTCTGDIDPAVVFYPARQGNSSIDETDHIFNKGSGMKGLTGEPDIRSVWAFIRDGSEPELQHKAHVAMDTYVNRLPKYIGPYAAEPDGLDVMSFIAGVDENDSGMCRELAKALAPLGAKIDVEKNELCSSEPLVISAPDSRVLLLIFPTNEELTTARQTLSII